MESKFNTEKLKRFEKLIENLSPNLNKNSLKLLNWVLRELSMRKQLAVTEYNMGYCICPCCYNTVDRDYIAYCGACGQSLKWKSMRKMKYVSYDEICKRLESRKAKKSPAEKKTTIEKEMKHASVSFVTINEIVDYLNSGNAVIDEPVASCFSTILTLLSEQKMSNGNHFAQ